MVKKLKRPWLIITLVLAAAAIAVYFFVSKKKATPAATAADYSGMTAEQKIKAVIDLIKKTPAWLAHVKSLATKENKSLDYKLNEEASYHIKKRPIQEIFQNPENFMGW